MKKTIAPIIILALALAITLFMCSCSIETESAEPNELVPIKPIEIISVSKALDEYRQNPNAEIDGYRLDQFGNLYSNKEDLGSAHLIGLEFDENVKFLENSKESIFVLSDNLLQKVSFGQIQSSFMIPEDARYCGIYKHYGFLFRKNSDVFYVNFDLTEMKLLAAGVKYIISCNYDFSPDNGSTPLFFMEDGTIKAYSCIDESIHPIT